jgi:hypothetical protein
MPTHTFSRVINTWSVSSLFYGSLFLNTCIKLKAGILIFYIYLSSTYKVVDPYAIHAHPVMSSVAFSRCNVSRLFLTSMCRAFPLQHLFIFLLGPC